MVLVDWQIKELAKTAIYPFNEIYINPASMDICVGNKWIDVECPNIIRKTKEVTIYKNTMGIQIHNFFSDLFYKIFNEVLFWRKPTAILLTTEERLTFPNNIAAEIKLKSTPTREGLGHPIADWIDPGFEGELTLMLYANKNVTIHRGQRICQLVFHKTHTPDKPYGVTGHYQNQRGPTQSWRV